MDHGPDRGSHGRSYVWDDVMRAGRGVNAKGSIISAKSCRGIAGTESRSNLYVLTLTSSGRHSVP